MLANMDPERLIEEVEVRPALFDKNLPDYANKKMKETLWMEVTRSLVDDFDELSDMEKAAQCKEIQCKWKHIRDNFRRELQAQKNAKPGVKRKRKYRYFDRMVFLIPYVYDGDTTVNVITTENNDSDSKQDNQFVDVIIDCPPSMDRPPPKNTYSYPRTKFSQNSFNSNLMRQRKRKKNTTFEEEILKNLKSKDDLNLDEDRTFCLSLVSSLKKMNNATKLSAKIDILKVIRQYTVPGTDMKPFHTESNQDSSNEDPLFSER